MPIHITYDDPAWTDLSSSVDGMYVKSSSSIWQMRVTENGELVTSWVRYLGSPNTHFLNQQVVSFNLSATATFVVPALTGGNNTQVAYVSGITAYPDISASADSPPLSNSFYAVITNPTGTGTGSVTMTFSPDVVEGLTGTSVDINVFFWEQAEPFSPTLLLNVVTGAIPTGNSVRGGAVTVSIGTSYSFIMPSITVWNSDGMILLSRGSQIDEIADDQYFLEWLDDWNFNVHFSTNASSGYNSCVIGFATLQAA